MPRNRIYFLNHTNTDHKEGEQLEDRRSVGASSCNSGDGTDPRAQSLMFMMMMMTENTRQEICVNLGIRSSEILGKY